MNRSDLRVDVLTQYVEGSTLDAAGLSHLRVTHAPTGLSAESRLRSQHACIADARRQIEQRLAELQRLDLSDPRLALEELATVPSLRERAAEALAILAFGDESAIDDARDEARRLLAEVLL